MLKQIPDPYAADFGLGMDCEETAQAAWKLVTDLGYFFVKPRAQCDGRYTTPCQGQRFSRGILFYVIFFCFFLEILVSGIGDEDDLNW